MPPKAAAKDKVVVVKGDEAEEMVLQYLKSVNRPYASTDVSANLKNKVPKAAAQKVLVTLAEKGSLTMKTYGKQTIFVYNQTLLPTLPPKELEVLESKLKDVRGELEEKMKDLKGLQNELSATEAAPQTKHLAKEIERVKAENEVSLKALLALKGDPDSMESVAPLSDEQIKKIDTDFTKWRKEWEARRRVYKVAIGMLQEGGLVTNVAEFEDEQGISPDDEDAQDVETGEFCRPKPFIMNQQQHTKLKTATVLSDKNKNVVTGTAGSGVVKRSGSTIEDGEVKKKKVKKA